MKKMLPWLVSLLLAITLIVIAGLYSWKTFYGKKEAVDTATAVQDSVKHVEAEALSAEERSKVTSDLNDIKTNLSDTNYIVIFGFTFQLENAKAKVEFDEIKESVIKPIINRALWNTTPDDMQGTKGKDELVAELLNEINPVLTKGNVVKIGITNFFNARALSRAG
ncbi:flagellar basal body-associated FliL family protein [Cohnella rhizosphaerae]|uniref:Flagellar protein FliL n=1 Tax=Cohnella rhizosphaerae TaxID=1457232 RepID=A0A9X4KX61_9BACL|nr:flagellar basal body-associated FliL family protein [Cohnella rhizosphaerae]MDG0812433.1 flagellar basal body-associated FliL family protein [Cohnella rhizosphaerae]